MTKKETTAVRIYNEDRDYLLLQRGRGTPADALNKILLNQKILSDIFNEESQ